VVTVQIQMDDKMSCFVPELHRFSLISDLHSVEISLHYCIGIHWSRFSIIVDS
jgi:hypothetical protein